MATAARCCLLLVVVGTGVQVNGLWNFRAVGEYVTTEVDDCNEKFSVDSAHYFEEVYYSDGGSINKTAFRIDSEETSSSAFFGDLKEGQVFLQLGQAECVAFVNNDPTIPHLKPWSFGSEAIYAPIYTTLTELKYKIMNVSQPIVERGLPAEKVWIDLSDSSDQEHYVETAYMTFERREDGRYDYYDIIPLTIETCSVTNGTRRIGRWSIVEFVWNTTVEEDASPAAGVLCPGYGRSGIPPVFNVSTLVLRTEQVVNGRVTTSDIALDFERDLLRIDNGVNDFFLSTSQNLVYNITNPDTRIQDCDKLEASDLTRLDWTFVDFRAKKAPEFFGVGERFKIKTRTKRRGIECDIVSGPRDDYISEKGTASVWEWCIGDIKTADGEKKFLVHLDIFIQPPDGLPYKESYSLYDIRSVEQKQMYMDYFTELEPCFGIDRKLNLQIIVDGQTSASYSDDDIETAVESGLFKAALLDALLRKSGLSPDSYRFGSTEAYILGSRDAVFQFYLFDAPENAPDDQRMVEVYKKLQKTLSEPPETIDVNGVKFLIRKDSLTEAHEIAQRTTTPSVVPQTEPSSPPTQTETSSASTQTETSSSTQTETSSPSTQTETSSTSTQTEPPRPPTPESRTTPSPPEPDTSTTEQDSTEDLPEVTLGYSGALVWGIAFAVLLVGGGVGAFAANKFLIK